MKGCQVFGCGAPAAWRCSAGFRYCAAHRAQIGTHGMSAGDRHAWARIRGDGGKRQAGGRP